MAVVIRNQFYVAIALVLAALIFGGFARTYYLRAWFEVPPITMLLHLHSIVFTTWFALFVIQTRLIAAHRIRAHMQLGIAAATVAALVVILGVATAVVSASAARPRPMGMNSAQFVFVPLTAMLFFAMLVTAAVALRHRSAWHKRLMTLAMIAVLGPPVARLIALTQNGEHFLAIQTAVCAAFVSWCLGSDWLQSRLVHPIYAVGGTALVLSWPVRALIARTNSWERVGHWLAGL